jgi:hypothetical protein
MFFCCFQYAEYAACYLVCPQINVVSTRWHDRLTGEEEISAAGRASLRSILDVISLENMMLAAIIKIRYFSEPEINEFR